jgi:hypothetical protein
VRCSRALLRAESGGHSLTRARARDAVRTHAQVQAALMDEQALRFYEMAADHGNTDAQFRRARARSVTRRAFACVYECD